MKIQILSAEVANQIAAGEVIERPQSVVKELVENALDAGAGNIHIDVAHGGLNAIVVSDDGEGILQEDLPLAITSHATSKLTSLDDLYALNSMGFRGEALASIASIARVNIDSKAKGAAHAMSLQHDEKGTRLKPCARNQGTTIEVKDLFFNAPVRKKFLKEARLEYQAIEAVIKRIALAHPEVGFQVRHDGKPKLSLSQAPSEKLALQRMTKIFGKAFMDGAIQVDVQREALRIKGFISGPTYARAQQDKMWFYINGRMIRDKLLLHALRQAYAHLLPDGRYPACVLHMTVPLTEVDINVHPTKHEVRFAEPRLVHDLIHAVIQEGIQSPVSEQAQVQSPAKSMPFQAQPEPMTQTHWQVLNARFALAKQNDVYHLLDIEALHRAMQAEALSAATLPWASRPLLVPVRLSLAESKYQLAKQLSDALSQYGLKYVVQDEHLQVKTLPQALPDLDLHVFFEQLSSEKDILQQLLAAEHVVAYAVTEEVRDAMLAFWCRDLNMPYSRPLDVSLCQEIVHDA